MTKISVRAHSATLIALVLATAGTNILVGCTEFGEPPVTSVTSTNVDVVPSVRFFGDEFADAYRALADKPVEAETATF